MPNPLYSILQYYDNTQADRNAYASLVMAVSPHLTYSRLLYHLRNYANLTLLKHCDTVVGGCMLKHHRHTDLPHNWHSTLTKLTNREIPTLELGYKVITAPAAGLGFSTLLSNLTITNHKSSPIFATCSPSDSKTYHTLTALGFILHDTIINPRTTHTLYYLERPANAQS